MELHQMQLAYSVTEDRILMRVSFREVDNALHEIRAWLSRRLVRKLWPILLQALETQVALEQPGAAHVKTDIVGMSHLATVSEMAATGQFAAVYEANAAHFPFGETPLLVNKVDMNITANQPVRVNFQQEAGEGFEMSLAPTILHGFCSMLQTAVAQADWDYELQLPGAEAIVTEERTLN